MLRNAFLRLTSNRHLAAAPKLAASLTMIAAFAVAPPARAQFFMFDDYPKPRYRQIPSYPREVRQPKSPKRQDVTSAPQTEARKAKKPGSEAVPQTQTRNGKNPASETATAPLYAVVSIEDQHVSIYGSNGLIERSDISSGTPDHPTPTGVFAIIQKERWHESNIYSGAAMPFMQRITWSGVAMHTGQLPGYPASHGCIRLPNSFAERWFGMTKLGLRVVVAPSDIEPKPIAHPNLPVPRYWKLPGVASKREPVQSAALGDETLLEFATPVESALNPIAYAIAEKASAKAAIKRAEQAESDAGDALEAANRAAKEAAAELKSAQQRFSNAEDRMEWFGLIGNRPPPSPKAKFGDGIMKAIADYELANTRLNEAARADAAARIASAEAAEAVKRADDRTEALKARMVEMGRRQETASIFISLKDRRLYVRQALKPVIDVPVEIRDSDTPIGTHVFVASPPAPGEQALRWTALTLPVEIPQPVRVAKLRRSSMIETGSIAAIPAETAAGALSRVQLPGEVLDQISELVWAGASVIISDRGITHETGVGTDFIIETKH